MEIQFFREIRKTRPTLYTFMHGGGGSSIVKVPGDVPPARVCFFKPSSLAKGIFFANFRPFSLGKGIIFGNFWSKKCQTSVIPVKKPKFFFKFWSLECKNSASFA